MVQVVDVLDIFGLPVTMGAVGVLEVVEGSRRFFKKRINRFYTYAATF